MLRPRRKWTTHRPAAADARSTSVFDQAPPARAFAHGVAEGRNLGLIRLARRVRGQPMIRASIARTLVVVAICWTAGIVSAQQGSTTPEAETGPSISIATSAPNQTSEERWLQVDLEEAKARSRRIRNALVGTSAGFAVGAILAGIGLSQCQEVPKEQANTYDSLLCNNAGKVMLPLGGTIAGLSFVGMLTSGIMLGVSNKRKREIQRDIRRSQLGRRLQWDIPSGALVF